ITDGMNMSAITSYYSSGEAAVRAVQAGVDVVLMPEDLESAAAGLREAVETGDLTEERIDESVLRILLCKLRQGIIAAEE
ncbi:MAG: glycoside hydrolase family 3 protein, partial [Clostridiales bacterium]|nr:glycoside hydrolase family 3 protein [Clostridiales bacterium]